MVALGPWALVTGLLSGAITWAATARRTGGHGLFDLRPDRSVRQWLWTILVLALLGFLFYDLARSVWQTGVPQTIITADCGGRAEPVTTVMRRPLLQTMPLLSLALAWWLPAIRAYAVSPRRGRPDPAAARPG